MTITVFFKKNKEIKRAILSLEDGINLYPSDNSLWFIAQYKLINLGHTPFSIVSIYSGDFNPS